MNIVNKVNISYLSQKMFAGSQSSDRLTMALKGAIYDCGIW